MNLDFTLPVKIAHVLIVLAILVFSSSLSAQIRPPGYEREMKRLEESRKMPQLERDSLTLVDTAVIFDPVTYESETIITRTRYSIKDYCIHYLGISNPDILLDHQPHKIIDPRTYDDLIIRLNMQGTIDTIPK